MKYNDRRISNDILFNPKGEEFARFFSSDFPKTDLILKHLETRLRKRISIDRSHRFPTHPARLTPKRGFFWNRTPQSTPR